MDGSRMGEIGCKHCNQKRPIVHGGEIQNDFTMYLIHLLRDHPDVIEKAREITMDLSPEFDWRYRPFP